MTTKLKAAAYRMTGGSQTAYPADFVAKRTAFEAVRKQTEKLHGTIDHIIGEYKSVGMNKFEKVGEAFQSYGAKFDKASATAALTQTRDTFSAVGKLHRDFQTAVEETVNAPIKQWLDKGGDETIAELKLLDNKRDHLDVAINKLRGKADDDELKATKTVAEDEFKRQMKVAEDKIDSEMSAVQKLLTASMPKFMELESKLFKDTQTAFEQGAAAITC